MNTITQQHKQSAPHTPNPNPT